MATRRMTSATVANPSLEPLERGTIRLTPARGAGAPESKVFHVALSELIAYSEEAGRTRLNLTRSRVLEVAESTGQIDQLVRAAARQVNLAPRSA